VAISTSKVGASDINSYLRPLLASTLYHPLYVLNVSGRGIFFRTDSYLEWDIQYIKHQYSHCRLEGIPPPKVNCELVTEETFIELDTELEECVEAIFNPIRVASLAKGIADMLLHTFNTVRSDEMRRSLSEMIYVYGGGTKTADFEERLFTDVNKKRGPTDPIKKIFLPDYEQRGHAAWKGASLLAQLPIFERKLFTRESYEEIGARGITKHIYGRSLQKDKLECSLPYVVAKPKSATDVEQIAQKVS
jgi:hypothetical protein